MLQWVGSALGLKSMVVGLSLSWQGIIEKAVCTGGGSPVCKCAGLCILEENVLGGGEIFLISY